MGFPALAFCGGLLILLAVAVLGSVAFGLSVGFAAPFLRLVVDVVPPGSGYYVEQRAINWQQSLQHSAAYGDPEIAISISGWLQGERRG